MPYRDIVVVGASSGGIEALGEIVKGLPVQLRAAVFVVQHLAANAVNYLPKMLARYTEMPCQTATEGEHFHRGKIYVAPADRHLIIDRQQMFLSHGPRENRVRPAIDPLFRSAALSHGPAVIGVVLSGSLDDGTAGLVSVGNMNVDWGIQIAATPTPCREPAPQKMAPPHEVELASYVPVWTSAKVDDMTDGR